MVMWEGNGDGGINTLDIYCVYLSLQKIWGPSHATFFLPITPFKLKQDVEYCIYLGLQQSMIELGRLNKRPRRSDTSKPRLCKRLMTYFQSCLRTYFRMCVHGLCSNKICSDL